MHPAPMAAGCAATCLAPCLTAPEDYDGGELVIAQALGEKAHQLPAGDLILYPSSTVHQVSPVTRGHRICSFFWEHGAWAGATPAAV